jgi:predicted deacetylase
LRADTIWSIHDVSPDSFVSAQTLVDRLSTAGRRPLCILVVPSGDWEAHQIDTLGQWESERHILAAHGWSHRATPARSFYHRMHARFFSRDVAEHLSKSSAESMSIVRRAERWFRDVGLSAPALYVPPAWALGSVRCSAFGDTGFRWVETLTGIYDVRADRMHRLPLVGFEADTQTRRWFLRASNAVNWRLGAAMNRPVRVAVHPDDPRLLLERDLAAAVYMPGQSLGPEDLTA